MCLLMINRELGACYSYFVPCARGPQPCAEEDKQVNFLAYSS